MASAPIDIGRLNGSTLRTLVDGVPDGLLVVDASGTIRYLNAAAAGLLRRPRGALVGSRLGLPLESSDAAELPADGVAERRLCSVRARPHRLGGEDVYLVSLREVTADARARRVAEAESDAKTALLTMIAHELRNPLGTIVGCLSMLAETTFDDRPEQRRRLVEMSQGKARDLQRLVDDLLTSARIETGRLRPNPRAVDLRAVVDGAIERARGRAALLSADIHAVQAPRAVPGTVDPEQVGIVLDNLVNNALTYSEGRPWVEVRLEAAGGRATITVADHGIGVADGDRARIFAPFERAAARTRHGGGTGLGLAIARGMAELNGGALELASSEPGAGSTFVLRLPASA